MSDGIITQPSGRERKRPQSVLSGGIGLVLAIASIGLLCVMWWLLDSSPLPILRQYAIVPAAVAGVLLIIAGSYVLEMIVPYGERQDRIRTLLGLPAHLTAALALAIATWLLPEARSGLAVVFLLEVAQAVRYALILRRGRQAA